ncbi:MAG: TetR family transcriptional regulator [Candidatus Hydrogenedentes bacterium]|nr:TetR family transcriptional regulator [Candidatus Hydrogenedentota bacterium]
MINSRPRDGSRYVTRQLVRAAADVFSINGFDAATTRTIANRAGVNIALIAYHFGNKEGLYRAVLADWAEGLCNAIGRDLSLAPGPAARTEAIVNVFLRHALIEAPGVAGLALRESVAAEASATALRTAGALRPVVELFDGLLPTCETAVASGAELLGLLLRLTAPMPALDGGGTEGFHRARARALALLRLGPAPGDTGVGPQSTSAPQADEVARYPSATPGAGLDFVD